MSLLVVEERMTASGCHWYWLVTGRASCYKCTFLTLHSLPSLLLSEKDMVLKRMCGEEESKGKLANLG